MYEIDLGLLNSGKIVSENTTNFLLSRAHDPRNEKKNQNVRNHISY